MEPNNNSAPVALTYKLSSYEGPIDLLYQLIQMHKIDILDIPIAELTNQYLEFLDKAGDRDMDSMSEFSLLAATLLEIKSRMLLPKANTVEEEDPRKELVDRLLEYKKIKLAAQLFMELHANGDEVFFKCADTQFISGIKPDETISEVLDGVTLDALYEIFKEMLGKKELKVDKIKSTFKSVSKDKFTVEEKSAYLLNQLAIKHRLSFKLILARCTAKMEMVVTFLALLELIKTHEIKVLQGKLFDDIDIRKC